MSTPPPPFPPGPPGGFTSGSPAWQTQPGGALSAPQEPSKSSKAPIIIGVLVVVAAIVVVLVLALGGSDESSGGDDTGFDAAAAHDGLVRIIEDASFDESGADDFRVCPLGDIDDLTAIAAGAVTFDDDVIEGTEEMGAIEETELPAFVYCQMYADDNPRRGPQSVYFQAILDPPRDYEEYITEFSGADTELDFQDTEEYLGGEIYLYCAEGLNEDGYTGCDADWVDTSNDIAINVFLGGTAADADEANEVLAFALPVIAANLALQAELES